MVVGWPVNRGGACLEGPVKRGIGVVDVQVDVGWSRRNLLIRVCRFDDAVADGHFRMHQLAVRHRHAQPFGRSKGLDRKSTRLNSSHVAISYAVFCLKKKNNTTILIVTRSGSGATHPITT